MHSILRKSLVLGTTLVVGAAVTATAQNVVPNFNTVPGSWSVDRYLPTTFSLTQNTHGRNNVLNIGITSLGDRLNRPAGYQYTFYNTQGEGTAVGSGPGSYSLIADLWVNASWATNAAGSNNSVRTDMWGVAVRSNNSPWDYPIIGFTNYGGTGLFRGYDVNTGVWDNFSNPVNYDAWNSLELSWNSSTNLYSYFVNGALAGTVQGDGIAVGIKSMIMQAYNFNDPCLANSAVDPNFPDVNCTVPNPSYSGSSDYTAQWSNDPAQLVTPEPATLMLLGTGLMGLVGTGLLRRRKN